MNAIVVDASIPLLPCPFCGSNELHVETESMPGNTYQVLCDNPECEAEGPNMAMNAEDAAKSWNRRARI